MIGPRGRRGRGGALLCSLLTVAAALVLSGCDRRASAGRQSVQADATTAAAEAAPDATAKPAPKLSSPSIAGVWVRLSPGGGGLREALVFSPDGSAGFVGVPKVKALAWSLDGQSLTVETNQTRYPELRAISLDVAELSADRLVLSDEDDYLAGEYHRDDGAVSSVSGTVVYDDADPLPETAVLLVTLEDVTWQEGGGEVIADAAFPVAGETQPLAFRLHCFTDQIEPTHLYSLRPSILINGKQRFKNTHPNLMLTKGHPKQLEVTLTRIEEIDPNERPDITREALRPRPAPEPSKPPAIKQEIDVALP